ncbi:MAG: terpene cyclase/mutase family protein [Candidatus Daviesbacteria bacterium]|nr:terpene cyclase/mutase family protein [Candidatus Daviesbacteria bacterium]
MLRLLLPKSILICLRDSLGILHPEHANEEHIKASLEWLKFAQDKSTDGGVSAWYSLSTEWMPSYIETTGYIISTFLQCSKYFNDQDLKKRAIKMGDFLIDMQNKDGSFRRQVLSVTNDTEPIIFDTGQDILGLTDLYQQTKTKKYLTSAVKAADFLCSVQEKDGSWIKFEYGGKPRSYETRTAWALLKVYKLTNKIKYKNFGVKNLDWSGKNQLTNGWIKYNELPFPNPSQPLVHTISYAIEGFLWSGILLNDKKYIKIAQKSADQILNYLNNNNYIPGTFNKNWKSSDRYTCLTGNAQISLVWLELYKITKNIKYLEASKKVNSYLKRTQDISTNDLNIRGGLKGSFPIYGDILKFSGYCRMAYLNWAVKFFIDSLIAENMIKKEKQL